MTIRRLLALIPMVLLLACGGPNAASNTGCPSIDCLEGPTGYDCAQTCSNVGQDCQYESSDLTCECDHKWHCTFCDRTGGSACSSEECAPPDGGYACD